MRERDYANNHGDADADPKSIAITVPLANTGALAIPNPSPVWSPGTSPLPAPAAPQPPPAPASPFPLTISAPSNGSTVTSPARVVASAAPTSAPLLGMRIYVDGTAVFWSFLSSIDTRIWMDPGTHTLDITAMDKNGTIAATTVQVTVVPPQAPGVSDIQTLSGWETCSAVFPPDSPRAGQICAAGLGTAQASMTEGVSSPSLDGQAAKFTIAGPTAYSNQLWYKSLGGGTNVTHFVYDLWFYIDNPTAAQALEFDVNQTFAGQRWTWGTECNFNGSGKWDIWDALNENWVPTSVDCKPFAANTWIHLVWNFERVNGQEHYISVTIDGVTHNVDVTYGPQANWTLEDINVAFQMDGNFKQEPYTVWLDKVTLLAY